jgi:hypothetical protein
VTKTPEHRGRVKIELTFRGHVLVPEGVSADSERWQSALATISEKGRGLINVLVSCPFCLAHGSMAAESFDGVWPVLFCEQEQKGFEVRFKEPVRPD